MQPLPKPLFVDETNAEQILSELVTYYEGLVGKTLEPGQTESFVLSAMAYRESLIRLQMQFSGEQNLLDFARFPMLDYLGAIVGTERLPAVPDQTTVLYTLRPGHTGVTIPAGHRIGSIDGKVVFQTMEDVFVSTGTNTVSLVLDCQTEGAFSYAIGTISVILDPLAFLSSAVNTDVTAGGADAETDDQLRERIRVAPGQFNSAGSGDAYIYWTKTASQTIIDVKPTTPVPGTVEVFPLVTGGIVTPSLIIDKVTNILSAQKVRPLTDTVIVTSPTLVNYDITVGVYLYDYADQAIMIPLIQTALQAYAQKIQNKLGLDITLDQITMNCYFPGVYRTPISEPLTDVIVGETQVGVIGTITVNFLGYTAG